MAVALPATREAFDIPTWAVVPYCRGCHVLQPVCPESPAHHTMWAHPPASWLAADPGLRLCSLDWLQARTHAIAYSALAQSNQRHKQSFSVFQHRKGVSAPLRMHASHHVASAAGQDVELSFALGFPYPALSCLCLRILQPVAGI